jgi:hypothetical protein
MVQHVQFFGDGTVILTDFDAQGPLAGRRQHERFVEVLGDAMHQSEPPDAGGRQNDRIEFFGRIIQFSQAGVHIAPQRYDLDIGACTAQLCCPPQAAGADSGGKGQLHKWRVLSRNENVGGIFTRGDWSDTKPLRQVGRHVLHAVDRQVDSTLQESLFDFFDEKSLAADVGQRDVEYFVAFGDDCDELNRKGREVFEQFRLNPVGLPQSKGALSGPDSENTFHDQWPQLEQLVPEHPLQEDPADLETVWPPPALLTKPQVDIRRQTSALLQAGQSGCSLPNTRHSKSSLHFRQ